MRFFHILIVEDDEALANALKLTLESMGFRNVDVAHNGFTALRMLISSQYDIILLDNQMPIISGLELLRRCRSGSILDWTTIIMITGNASGDLLNAIKTEELKVDEFIVKPVDFQVLTNKIDRLMRGMSSPSRRLVDITNMPPDLQKGVFLSVGRETNDETAIIRLFGFFLHDDRNLVKDMPEQIASMPEKSIVFDLTNVLMIDEVGIGILLLINSVASMAGKNLSMVTDDRTIGKRLTALGLTKLIPVIDKTPEMPPLVEISSE